MILGRLALAQTTSPYRRPGSARQLAALPETTGPEQVHLSLGGPSEMVITYATADEAPSSVEWWDASGATLTLGAWADSVEFRVGAAPLWTLLPGSTRERVLAERKELFGATHRAAATRMQRDLDAADNWTPSAEDEVVWGGRASRARPGTPRRL